MSMEYREACLQRIAEARCQMDRALATASSSESLLETWHGIWRELQREQAPEADRMWLADRLDDLRTHVQGSSRWRELI